jgi:ABC-type polysaccharide/polyol phosphate transport system ATPase subunit
LSNEHAIRVDSVSKRFRLYHERNSSLKATVMRGRRARYEEFWALNDVSLEIPEGSTFGLIGENGSGKSTLLKCMARILRPDTGGISTRGKISALLELGAGFHPELSGRENVFLNGSILGVGKRQLKERFDEIVAFAGLEQFIDAPVKNYSSGMYVRLGFSVAINVDPDILLIDEVLTVGDAEFQRRCVDKFAELRAGGKTVVIVTHALTTVRELCDEAALLEHGVLQALGPAGDVVDQYLGDVFGEEQQPSRDEALEGRAAIERIDMLDRHGACIEEVRTGDSVTLRLHFSAPTPVRRPVFGLSVHSLDGIELTRPSTVDAGIELGQLTGTGHVDLRVERLLLLPGSYDLTASLVEGNTSTGPADRERGLRITVVAGQPQEEHGLVSLGGVWDVSGNGAVA